MKQGVDENLPPRELWPERLYQSAALSYLPALNLAAELLKPCNSDPQRTAIRWADQSVSYDALRRRTLTLASVLSQLGVRPTDRVGLRVPNRPDFVAGFLAIQWLGAIGVQLSPAYRRREIAEVVNDAGVSAILCDRSLVADVEAAMPRVASCVRMAVIGRRQDVEGADPSSVPEAHPTGRDRPALITYIASADGPLKGVVHTAADLLSSADLYARRVLNLTASDVCIGSVGMSWAYGLGALLTFPLRAGATTVLVDGAMNLLQTIEAVRPTVLFSVPTMYRMLLRHLDLRSYDLQSLRCCVSAAEALPPDLARAWRDRTGLDIVDGFGTTELTHIVISSRPGHVRPGLLGTAVDGYDVRIVDDAMEDVPDGHEGRLAVRGPTGALYWRNADAQRRSVRGGWTLTGDICIRHADGWFEYISRADDLIVSAGYKISAREIERALEEHPDVLSARVFSAIDTNRGAVAHASVIPTSTAERQGLTERLHEYLMTELAAFKVPREIHVATPAATSA